MAKKAVSEETSPEVASKASKQLSSGKTSADGKSVAASDLAQAPSKSKKSGK